MIWCDERREQYREATTRGKSINLGRWTTLRVTGADRASFLHNMCTNDIKGLAVGGQCEAFLTDVKGKIVGHVVVLAEADHFLLLTVPGQAEQIITSLERYIIREDIQLVDVSANLNWALMVGPIAATEPSVQAVRRLHNKHEWVMAPCLQLWCGGAWVGAVLDPEMAEFNETTLNDTLLWQALRIESGWPLFGIDFDDTNLPQEVGRDAQALNFRKGCYLGQETIARIDALGHVNKRLATIKLAGEAAPGDELHAGDQVVGHITSASYSPQLDAWLALAMVRRGHNEPGAQLACRDQSAEVLPTPAVVPPK